MKSLVRAAIPMLMVGLVLAFLDTVWAQESGSNGLASISFGPNVQISTDDPTVPHVESFLALNPKDASELIASSIVAGPGLPAAVYISRDAGRSWNRSASLTPGVAPISGGDPLVYYDLNGAALFAGLCDSPDCSLRVFRSSDGGDRWDSAASIPGRGYDREYLAVDMTSSPFSGRIYVAGTNWVRQTTGGGYPVMAIASSTDGARTFSPAIILDATSDGKSHGFGGIADMLITTQGTLVIPIQSSPGLIPSPERQFYTLISQDGGRTFSTPQPGLMIGVGPRGFRSVRAGGNIRATIDNSAGRFSDRLYVAYIEFENDRYDVKVTHSDDLGVSWSPATTVNDNSGPNDTSNAAIAVNRDGIVALAWNDRRDDPKLECYRVYVSASLDGGDTFLRNVQVNPRPTCPNTQANWSASINAFSPRPGFIALSGTPSRFSNGGETQGLVAGRDGRFQLAWINGESGVMQLWFSSFSVRTSDQTVHRVRQAEQMAGGDETADSPERTDRTKQISLEVNGPVLDFNSKTLEFTVRLKNQTSAAISGPLILVLDGVDSEFAALAVSNADNGMGGRGASWKFVVGDKLGPGAVSGSRIIRWHFDGKVPQPLTNIDVFRGNFRVVAQH